MQVAPAFLAQTQICGKGTGFGIPGTERSQKDITATIDSFQCLQQVCGQLPSLKSYSFLLDTTVQNSSIWNCLCLLGIVTCPWSVVQKLPCELQISGFFKPRFTSRSSPTQPGKLNFCSYVVLLNKNQHCIFCPSVTLQTHTLTTDVIISCSHPFH